MREISETALDVLKEHFAELRDERDTQRVTMATLYSVFDLGLTMVSHGIDVNDTQAPATAMSHARHLARRGADIDGLLRYYRLSHAHFWQWAIASPELQAFHQDRHAVIIQEMTGFSHRFLDIMSSQVTTELLAEHSRIEQVTGGTRERTLAAIVAGEPISTDEAAEALGVAPEQRVVCVLPWRDTGSEDEDDHGVWLGGVGTGGLPLVLRHPGSPSVWWLRLADERMDPERLHAEIRRAQPGARVAVSAVHTGVEGLRTSYGEALRARRIARLSPDGPRLTAFSDIAMVDLLSRDTEAACEFVRGELGALASRDERDALLRHTVRTFFAAQCAHASAAAALGVHRNTLRQRLERAGERRGADVLTRQLELQAALLLAEALPDLVLRED